MWPTVRTGAKASPSDSFSTSMDLSDRSSGSASDFGIDHSTSTRTSSSSSISSTSSRGLLQSIFPSFLGLLPQLSSYSAGAGAKGTFKPIKEHTGNKRVSLHRYSQATLATGITRAAVACPPTEDPNEWLAVHTVDAYNELALLYGVIHAKCSPSKESCSVMNAGPEFEYLWADSDLHKKPTKVSAKDYVNLLLSWVEKQLHDPAVFPPSTNIAFPRTFKVTVAKIFTRLFRVYGHIYLVHAQDVEQAGAMSHLNSCFKHFIFCVLEFDLVEDRELVPLHLLIRNIVAEDTRKQAAARPSIPAVSSSSANRGLGWGRPCQAAVSASHSPHQARMQRLRSNSGHSTNSCNLRPANSAQKPMPSTRQERSSFPSPLFPSSPSPSTSSSFSSPSTSTLSPSLASRSPREEHRMPRTNSTGTDGGHCSTRHRISPHGHKGKEPRAGPRKLLVGKPHDALSPVKL